MAVDTVTFGHFVLVIEVTNVARRLHAGMLGHLLAFTAH